MVHLSLALEIARANPISDLPKMAAVIGKRRKILGIGMNSRKSDPLQLRFASMNMRVCKHAEIAAIKNALKNNSINDIKGASIYIARVYKNGEPALAKPCEGCSKALEAFGIQNIFYTE